MLQKLTVLFLVCFLFQCQDDGAVRKQAVAEVQATAEQAAAPPVAAPSPAPTRTDLAPGQTAPTTSQSLQMTLGTAETKVGESACLPVTATGFTDLIGLQFSIRWDPATLTFDRVENFDLPDLSSQNFGATYSEKGVVALSWIHMNLQGVSLANDSHLFDICFVPTGEAISPVEVRFEPRPTPYEVVNTREEILEFVGKNGQITLTQ
ncbi:MAG: cohesin domain-containing protein [Bacteroidota bacterium]